MSLQRTWLGRLAGVWGAGLAALAALVLLLVGGGLGRIGAVREALAGPGIAPLPAPASAPDGAAALVPVARTASHRATGPPSYAAQTGASGTVSAGTGVAGAGSRGTLAPGGPGPASGGARHRGGHPWNGPGRGGSGGTAGPSPSRPASALDPVISAGAGIGGQLPEPAGPAAAGAVRAAGGAVDGLLPGGR